MLNLLPPQQKKELRLDLLNQAILSFSIAVILAIIILATLLLVARVFLNTNLKGVEQELELWQAKAEIKELESLEEKIGELNRGLVFLDKVQREQFKPSLILGNLAKDVVPGIRFDNLSIKKTGEVDIKGHALTRDILLVFKNNLEKAAYVSNFDFPLSNLTRAENIDFYLSFKLSGSP